MSRGHFDGRRRRPRRPRAGGNTRVPARPACPLAAAPSSPFPPPPPPPSLPNASDATRAPRSAAPDRRPLPADRSAPPWRRLSPVPAVGPVPGHRKRSGATVAVCHGPPRPSCHAHRRSLSRPPTLHRPPHPQPRGVARPPPARCGKSRQWRGGAEGGQPGPAHPTSSARVAGHTARQRHGRRPATRGRWATSACSPSRCASVARAVEAARDCRLHLWPHRPSTGDRSRAAVGAGQTDFSHLHLHRRSAFSRRVVACGRRRWATTPMLPAGSQT